MTIVSMVFGGILSGLVFIAIPTILIVYLVAKLGSILGGRRGFFVAGYIAAIFSCIPFISIAGFYVREMATAGLRYPQYGDQFLGFYLLGGSLVCAVAALSTVKLSERLARFFAKPRNDERPT